MHMLRALFVGVVGACLFSVTAFAQASYIDIPAEDMCAALMAYIRQSGVELLYDPESLRGLSTQGVHGLYDPAQALVLLLRGTDATFVRDASGAFGIVRQVADKKDAAGMVRLASGAPRKVTVMGAGIPG